MDEFFGAKKFHTKINKIFQKERLDIYTVNIYQKVLILSKYVKIIQNPSISKSKSQVAK